MSKSLSSHVLYFQDMHCSYFSAVQMPRLFVIKRQRRRFLVRGTWKKN